jgi:diacylglycerol kinase family enzyme
MYFAAVIQTILFNHVPNKMRIELDGQIVEQENLMVVVCNGPREGGGFVLAPEAKPDDGIFSYLLARKMGRVSMFRTLIAVLQGTHAQLPQITMGTCKKLSLVSENPIYIHTDGEVLTGFGSNVRRISVEILPGALQVIKG